MACPVTWYIMRKHGLSAPRAERSSSVARDLPRTTSLLVHAASCRQRNHTRTGPDAQPRHSRRADRFENLRRLSLFSLMLARQPCREHLGETRTPCTHEFTRVRDWIPDWFCGAFVHVRGLWNSRARPRAHPQRCDRRTLHRSAGHPSVSEKVDCWVSCGWR